MTKLHKVRVSKKYIDGQNISIIELEPKDQQALPLFEAGAHIDLYLPNGLVRQYSLCQNPNENIRYRLGILNDDHSRGGSRCAFEDIGIGADLEISSPKNLFPLNQAEHSVLIGGGIGITPLISMAYHLLNENKSFELHYCGASADRSAFVDELQNGTLAAFTHFHFKDDGANHRAYFQDHFPSLNKQSHIYTCGPNPFMDWVFDLSKKHQFSPEQIHKEVFQSEVELTGNSFEVFAQQSNKLIQVDSNETLLEALVKNGISIEKSCEQGVCGTCLCMVLEGEPDHRDVYLTDEEKADNDQILVCCSRAKSKRLVLDI